MIAAAHVTPYEQAREQNGMLTVKFGTEALRSIPAIVGLMTICLAMVGCDGRWSLPRIAAVGTVTLDGQPLRSGKLVLQPTREGLPSATADVVDGQFQFTPEDGPAVGSYRVRFEPNYVEFEQFRENPRSLPSPKKPMIAQRFADFGSLTVTVTPAGIEPNTFALQSR